MRVGKFFVLNFVFLTTKCFLKINTNKKGKKCIQLRKLHFDIKRAFGFFVLDFENCNFKLNLFLTNWEIGILSGEEEKKYYIRFFTRCFYSVFFKF